MDTRLSIPLYTQEDWDTLARTILGEARNQPLTGQIAVAWTIRNRYVTKRFGKTIREICLAHSQYSCWNRNDPNCAYIERARISDPLLLRALWVAGSVILGDEDDPTNGATHYFNPRVVNAYWAKGLIPSAIIEDHHFYNNVS